MGRNIPLDPPNHGISACPSEPSEVFTTGAPDHKKAPAHVRRRAKL